jgi:glycosyltransferase involved in cell wall biosynthesis
MLCVSRREESTPAARALGEDVCLSLFVACYNESGNITGAIETAAAAAAKTVPSFEIAVVDDGSKDESVAEVRAFMHTHPDLPIRLFINEHNQGVANNYVDASFLTRGEWYRMICGDNVESEETMATIFGRIGKADVLIPYYVQHPGRAVHRRILSKCFTALVNMLSGNRLHYYNGMPLTRRFNVMRWHSNSHGFGFQADFITRLLAFGATFEEVGVVGRERAGGSSTALTMRNFASVLHSLMNIFILSLSSWLHRRR